MNFGWVFDFFQNTTGGQQAVTDFFFHWVLQKGKLRFWDAPSFSSERSNSQLTKAQS